jgi:uncharacterized protein YndB with AHSA1/START domain
MKVVEPARRLVLADYRYFSRRGGPPEGAKFQTEFLLTPEGEGTRLRVAQDGFPPGPDGDAFLEGCVVGWRNTFAGLRRHLSG